MINKKLTFLKNKLSGLVKKISKPFVTTKKKDILSIDDKQKATSAEGKNVLMFGWELPPFNSGGLGVACYEMAEAIADKKTKVTFVLPTKHDISAPFDVKYAELKKSLRDKNISIEEINSLLSPYLTKEAYTKLKKKYGKAIADFNNYGSELIDEVMRYGEAAKEIAKKEKFDVIHAHDWLAYPAGIKAKEVTGKPLVVHVHALEYDRSHEIGLNKGICAIEKEGLEKADKVIAISQWVKDRVIKFYGIDPAKIEIVHNGIAAPVKKKTKLNIDSFKKNGTKVVLSVGRITYQKGIEYLIEAAQKALRFNENIVFVIVGNGDMMNRMLELTARLGISDKVLFPGFLRGKELEDLYQAADVFVMPSVSEPFGLVALEALTNRVPVILSNQSGAKEVIKHSLTADFWDTDELANKIVTVLQYNSMHKLLTKESIKEVKGCTWSSAADKCINIYNSVCTA